VEQANHPDLAEAIGFGIIWGGQSGRPLTDSSFPKKLLASPRKAIKLAKEAAAGEVRQDSPK